jgi:Family of unknown function (DUF6331)
MTQAPIEIQLAPRLEALIKSCERSCVHDCCGIDAFDFSPLYIAGHMSAYTGSVSQSDVEEVIKEIDELMQRVLALTPTPEGWICSIKGMNQFFSVKTLSEFAEELKFNIKLAQSVVDLSEEIRFKRG